MDETSCPVQHVARRRIGSARRRVRRDPRIGLDRSDEASWRGPEKMLRCYWYRLCLCGCKSWPGISLRLRKASAEDFYCCAAEVNPGERAAESDRFRRRRGRLGKPWPFRNSCAGVAAGRGAETRQVLPVIRSITTVMTLPNASSLSGLRPIHGKDCRLARSRRRDWRQDWQFGQETLIRRSACSRGTQDRAGAEV